MNVVLSPPSGHAESYLDITFRARFNEPVEQVEITIFNDTSGESLDILGVIGGHIVLGKTAVFRKTQLAEGFINIFNRDKMNKKFGFYRSVNIKFIARIMTNGNEHVIEDVVTFYNESKSLDADIIPFDMVLDSTKIDIEHNIPMGIQIISDVEKSYEICIKADNSDTRCNFVVSTKRGRTNIQIPAEIIYADLELENEINRRKRYRLYYVKREGVTFARLMNKKYVPIADTQITFRLPEKIMPQAQSRLSPTGTELSKDFVLSDRYLVHTHKDFSSFGKKTDFHPRRLDHLTRFLHEAQHMTESQNRIRSFKVTKDDLTDETRETMRSDALRRQSRIKQAHRYPKDREQMMQSFSTTYEEQFSANVTTDLFYLLVSPPKDDKGPSSKESKEPIRAFQAPPIRTPSAGCLPCSRRRRK